MELTQFEELVSRHYHALKDLPEYAEAHNIYLELPKVRERLSEIEAERLQYYNDLANP